MPFNLHTEHTAAKTGNRDTTHFFVKNQYSCDGSKLNQVDSILEMCCVPMDDNTCTFYT